MNSGVEGGFCMTVRAHLEFAALDQLEGEDCGSLLSKGVTHRRHAARCDAPHILHNSSHESLVEHKAGNRDPHHH